MALEITSWFTTSPDPSPTAHSLLTIFGLGFDQSHKFILCDRLKIDLKPRQILFITGQSGSGKSCLLKILKKHLTPTLDLDRIRPSAVKILVDQFRLPLAQSLKLLSLAGLADAFLFLRKPSELSDGQLFRLKLALALAKKPAYLFVDGFLDALDRLTAQILAANLRKIASRSRTAFLLASPHNDFLDQLAPDIYIEQRFAEPPLIRYR